MYWQLPTILSYYLLATTIWLLPWELFVISSTMSMYTYINPDAGVKTFNRLLLFTYSHIVALYIQQKPSKFIYGLLLTKFCVSLNKYIMWFMHSTLNLLCENCVLLNSIIFSNLHEFSSLYVPGTFFFL